MSVKIDCGRCPFTHASDRDHGFGAVRHQPAAARSGETGELDVIIEGEPESHGSWGRYYSRH
jgi:hypothetical protein